MPKLWSALGTKQANHKKVDTADKEKFAQVRHTKKGQKPGLKPQRQSKDMHSWARGDQMTINQGYAQPPTTCKGQIDTPRSSSQKP